MATLRTVIIDTDNAYAGFDYTTLTSANSTEQGDISLSTGSDEYVVFECYATSGTADTAQVNIDGWITEPTNYIEVTGMNDAAEYHNGVWDVTKYRLTNINSSAFVVTEEHVRVTGLQIQQSNTTSTRQPIVTSNASQADTHFEFSYNLLKGNGGSSYAQHGIRLEGTNAGQVVLIWNNIIFDTSTFSTSYGIRSNHSGTTYAYNNTIIGGTSGLNRNAGTTYFVNNLTQGQVTSGVSWAGSVGDNTGWNVVDDATLIADSMGGSNTDLTTGTATSYTANKLNDSGGGLSAAILGSLVANTTDLTYAYVTTVDSDTQLTLSADIFDTGNEAYRVTSNIHGVVEFVDSGSDNYLLDYLDELAMLHGVNKYADASLPVTDDILGTSRGNANTDFYDIGAFHSLEYGHVVDPDSGTGFDYTSLSTWESNEQADLPVTAKNKICTAVCRCTGGTNDTTAVTINGWTTDATGYPKVWTDPTEAYRHPGYWITGNYYRLVVSNAAAIDNREADFHVEGLQVQVSSVSTTDQCGIISQYFSTAAVSHQEFVGNVFKGAGGSIGATQWHFGIQVTAYSTGSSGQIDIYNNIIFDFGGVENYSNGGIEFYNDGANPMYIDCFAYNNTIQNCSKGLESSGTGTGFYLFVKNNLIDGGHRGYNLVSSSTFGSSSTHNVWNNTPVSEGAFGVQWASGTITSTESGKLIDTGKNFISLGVQVGSIVKDTTDSVYTYVTAIDSATTLSLANDYFTGTESYIIYTNMRGTVTFQDAGSDIFLLGASDTAAKDKGADLSGDSDLLITDDILGTSRPQ